MTKATALQPEVVEFSCRGSRSHHLVHRVREGVDVDAATFVRSAVRGNPVPERLQGGGISPWCSKATLAARVRELHTRLEEEEGSSWTVGAALVEELRELATLLAEAGGILLFPVGEPTPAVTPVACFDQARSLRPAPRLLPDAVRDAHVICIEPSPTKNHGDITRCKQRYMIECRRGNAVGVLKPGMGEPPPSSLEPSALVAEATLAQRVAEAMVLWFRRLRCDLNLLRSFHSEKRVGEASDWSRDLLHRDPPIASEDEVQQAGRRICETMGMVYTPERVLNKSDLFSPQVIGLQRSLAQHAQSIPLSEEVSPSNEVGWGALVNLYLQHGGSHVEQSFRGQEDEVDRIVGSVVMTGRWEHAWGRSDAIVDIPPKHRHMYDVVALKDDDDAGGALRFRLHDLSEVAKSKTAALREPPSVTEWFREELRYDGRDGKPCLLMRLPRWTEETGGYVGAVDGCRMWSHLPPILERDKEATRSWSLWKAFDACAVKSGSASSCFVGLTRVRIGQLSDDQSGLLMDATVVEEAWNDSVARLLLVASVLCHEDADARRRFMDHIQSAGGLEEAQRRIVAEVGPEEWRRAGVVVEEDTGGGLSLHDEMMEMEPFGGGVPPAVEVSRALRCVMAYMGHIVATNGKYTKRGRKNANKTRVKKGERLDHEPQARFMEMMAGEA